MAVKVSLSVREAEISSEGELMSGINIEMFTVTGRKDDEWYFITHANHEALSVKGMDSNDIFRCLHSTMKGAMEDIDYIKASAAGNTRNTTKWLKHYNELLAMDLEVHTLTVT